MRQPRVIPLDAAGLRMTPTRLYVEGGWVYCGDHPGWFVSEVRDTGRRSTPEGWPVLRFAASSHRLEAPLDCDMIVEGGLAAITGAIELEGASEVIYVAWREDDPVKYLVGQCELYEHGLYLADVQRDGLDAVAAEEWRQMLASTVWAKSPVAAWEQNPRAKVLMVITPEIVRAALARWLEIED